MTVVSYHAHWSLLLSKLSPNDGVYARVVDADDGFEDVRYMAALTAELLYCRRMIFEDVRYMAASTAELLLLSMHD